MLTYYENFKMSSLAQIWLHILHKISKHILRNTDGYGERIVNL